MSRLTKKRRQKEEAEREELLAPDAFEAQGQTWTSWVEKNLKLIVGGVVFVLLAIVGVEIVRSSGQGEASDHTKRLIDAVEGYQEAVSLRAVATSTSAAMDAKRYREARSGLVAVLELNASEEIKALAQLYLADLDRRLGDHPKAIEGYAQYLETTGEEDSLRFFALEGKGYAHEAADELDAALGAFQAIEALEPYADFGHKHVARVLRKMGDLAGAKAALEEIVAREPESPLKSFAEQQLATID